MLTPPLPRMIYIKIIVNVIICFIAISSSYKLNFLSYKRHHLFLLAYGDHYHWLNNQGDLHCQDCKSVVIKYCESRCRNWNDNNHLITFPMDIVTYPDSKVHGANMGSIWGRQDPGGPHVSPMNFVIRVSMSQYKLISEIQVPLEGSYFSMQSPFHCCQCDVLVAIDLISAPRNICCWLMRPERRAIAGGLGWYSRHAGGGTRYIATVEVVKS